MSEKLKVSYEEVSRALTSINHAATSLQVDMNTNAANENRLDFVKKVNEVNTTLVQVTEQYKQLLKEHNEQVETSLMALYQVDQALSTAMGSFSSGIKQALNKN